jgi:hypothetical protein
VNVIVTIRCRVMVTWFNFMVWSRVRVMLGIGLGLRLRLW